MTYTAISLCSGIAGLDLAASAAGFDITAQVEIDRFCQQVLTKHRPRYWPNAKLFEDVRNVGRNELGDADFVFGGFPCQDISIAGERAGIERGTRSGLWFEFARIIGDLRPRAALLENVDDIVSLGGTTVIGDLAALGYDAVWFTLRASDVDAPHGRERWFCVAYPDSCRRCESAATNQSPYHEEWHPAPYQYGGWPVSGQTWASSEAVGNPHSFRNTQERAIRQSKSSPRHRKTQPERAGYQRRKQHVYQSRMGTDADGLSTRMASHRWPAGFGAEQYDYEPSRTVPQSGTYWKEQVHAIGNAVVPQVAYPLFVGVHAWLKAQDALESAMSNG